MTNEQFVAMLRFQRECARMIVRAIQDLDVGTLGNESDSWQRMELIIEEWEPEETPEFQWLLQHKDARTFLGKADDPASFEWFDDLDHPNVVRFESQENAQNGARALNIWKIAETYRVETRSDNARRAKE